jgi:hypothetical protein
MKNKGLGIVEGSAPSKTDEKSTCIFSIRGAGDVGAPVTRDSFAPTAGKRKNFG